MSQTIVQNTTQLAANAVYNSGFLLIDIDAPYLAITVQSDQPGTLVVFERTGDGSSAQVLKVPIAGASIYQNAAGALLPPPVFVWQVIKQSVFMVQFINAPGINNAGLPKASPTQAFSISFGYNASPDVDLSRRIDWLQLKELRAISLLLASLKEPLAAQVNVPYGVDSQEPN